MVGGSSCKTRGIKSHRGTLMKFPIVSATCNDNPISMQTIMNQKRRPPPVAAIALLPDIIILCGDKNNRCIESVIKRLSWSIVPELVPCGVNLENGHQTLIINARPTISLLPLCSSLLNHRLFTPPSPLPLH